VSEAAGNGPAVILEARNLSKDFPVSAGVTRGLGRRRFVHAVRGVSLTLREGSITALVGESGSGKSTLGRLFAGLYRPTQGEVLFGGSAVRVHSLRTFRRYARSVQLILQDPYASLNPHRTIGYHVTRPLRIHKRVARNASRAQVIAEACTLLEQVGLNPGENFYYKFPHELSGGQRQRASIARAMGAHPRVLIGDEPVSMLDVSLRRGILEIFRRLQQQGLTILYITHDLPSAAYFAETIAVMYAGEVVEQGPARTIVDHPAHPYTQLLLSATPDPFAAQPGAAAARFDSRGEPPSLISPPSGCTFHPRCPHAFDTCSARPPALRPVGLKHQASCWLLDAAGDDRLDDALAESPDEDHGPASTVTAP
jgi:peptide/nickel transport system ATP-binding protein